MSHANDADHLTAVPTLVREFEAHLDRAFAAYGDLAAALPRARLEARLSAVVGQAAIDYLSQAGAALGTARGHAVHAHRVLDKVAKTMGIETAVGDEQPKPTPDTFWTGADGRHLEVISQAG